MHQGAVEGVQSQQKQHKLVSAQKASSFVGVYYDPKDHDDPRVQTPSVRRRQQAILAPPP
jgi:hypothetical protein